MATTWLVMISIILAAATARIIIESPQSNSTSFLTRHSRAIKYELPSYPDVQVTREKRSINSPFLRDEKCKISYQEMTGVADLLKMYLSGQATADVPYSPATSGLNACQQAMQDIRATAKELITLSNQIKTSGSSISTDEYNKLKKALDETTSSLQQQLDRVKQQASQNAQLQIREVEREKQNMKTAMDKLLQELTQSRTAHQNDILALTASEIDSGNIENAVKKFSQLNDNRLLVEVVKKAYKFENSVHIMRFLENLPWLIHRAKGYLTLLDLILAGSHQTSPIILIIHGHVLEHLKKQQEPHVWAESKPYFDEIQRKLKKPVADILQNWSELIRNKNTEQIRNFSYMFQLAFTNIVADLVKEAFKPDDSTIDALFKFADELPVFHSSAIAYSTLYNKMSVNLPRALRMAYKINQLKDMKNFAKVGEETKKLVQTLWDSLPSAVKPLVTGENVCIKNDGFSSYYTLYVKDHYDSDRDNVNAKPSPGGISQKWKFETEEENEKLQFRIKSDPYGDYLYAASDQFNLDSSRRRVFTWRSSVAVHQGSWTVQDADWRAGKFYLHNTYQNEYLNVNSDERVYTYRYGGRGDKPVWKISAC